LFSFSFSFLLWARKHGSKSANSNFLHNSLWLFHLWCPYCSISNPDPEKDMLPWADLRWTSRLLRITSLKMEALNHRAKGTTGTCSSKKPQTLWIPRNSICRGGSPLTRPYKSICQGGSPPYPRLQINFQRRVTCLWKPILLETNLYPPLQNFLFLTTLFLPFFSFIILPSHF